MVLAGSIGLHHVVADVSVVNDLSNVSVGQLSVEDADYLAACLLLGERIPVRDLPVVARRLASAASYVPFYIQKLVVALTTRIRSVSADDLDLDELVAEALRADTWQTSHYLTRLPDVFRDPRAAEVAALLLDEIALSDRRSTVDMLAAGLAGRVRPTPTPDLLSTLLLLLQKDHYLRPAGPAWQFATELLRCAWIQHRGL